MATISELAQKFIPRTVKNISELKSIPTNLVVLTDTGHDNEKDEDYVYNYIEVNGERYRIPDSVLASLKEILDKKKDLKNFAVSKVGEGRKTRYTVIPLD